MPRRLATGEQKFVTLRQDNLFYIDKTRFIQDWWEGRVRATLVTRPRRFGKTLMLDTVKTFFSLEYAGRSDLFEGLAIWKNEQFRKLQGTIPVIFFSFAPIKATNYHDCLNKIKEVFVSVYDAFREVLDTLALSVTEKEQVSSVRQSMENFSAQSSILHLSKYVSRKYGLNPIILIDEYDTPLLEAWIHGYWDDIACFMRGFFNSTLKTNPYLGRGLITGITRVAKESIFSDLNNLKVVSITSNHYADCFGFTEQEVFSAMDEYELTNREEVKYWYDGFIFGEQKEIYNPWSVIEFLAEKKINLYWGNTSSNALVDKLIAQANVNIKDEFKSLLQGEAIITNLDEEIVFSDFNRVKGAIWSLLLASGYVKPLEFDFISKEYKLAFTNNEVRVIMEDIVSQWFNNNIIDSNQFCQALLSDDLDGMNTHLGWICENVFSFFDTAGKEPERFYHAFVLGLIVDLQEHYEITSNHESGYGRYDVMMIPKRPCDHGIVIEFKTKDPQRENSLQKTSQNALKQIKEKKYISRLLNRNIESTNIYIYGFAFEGKNVLIQGGAYHKIDWRKKFSKRKRIKMLPY